jgi:hypothetical protein
MGGIGAAYMTSIAGGPSSVAMLTLKVPQRPFVIGLSGEYWSWSSVWTLAATADWRILQAGLGRALGLSAGPGMYVSVPISPMFFAVALRVPVGISWYPRGVAELFLEIAPAVAFQWYDENYYVGFRLQVTAGARYLFGGE